MLNLSGYLLVRAFYTGLIPIRADPSSSPSSTRIFILAFCMFLTGAGGSSGLSASVNAAAKSFPDKTRATATGTVLAGFGLSAFAFSSVGHLVYESDAGGLLLLLAIGTSVPMLVASFFVRPIPPSREAEGYAAIADEEEILVDDDDDEGRHRHPAAYTGSRSTSFELTRSRSPSPRGRVVLPSSSASKTVRRASLTSLLPSTLSYSPLDLLRMTDFHILFVILALLCGTGLMYINNAGTVALALAREGHLTYNKKSVSAWQGRQVATVSVWNCSGRILGGRWGRSTICVIDVRLAGAFSDLCKSQFHMSRVGVPATILL